MGPFGAPWYTSREEVRAALDFQESSPRGAQIDRAIEDATRSIEYDMRRKFYPQAATRTKDWPNPYYYQTPWHIWLDADEVVSVSQLTSGGVTIPPSGYLLRPDSGPPFTRIEINLGTAYGFNAGSTTWQRAIQITGVFGFGADTAPAGALTEALDASETGVDVTDSASVGVGDAILIDTEYMIIQGKSQLDTGQVLQNAMAASAAGTILAVTSGAAFVIGETLLLDAEKMLITDIAGNTLLVKRAVEGTVLASHTASTIYAPRTLVVQRGALGTTAATHTISAAVKRHMPPGPVRDLAVARALDTVLQETSGYARTIGSGDNTRAASGGALNQATQDLFYNYGRKTRNRAV